jgi:hypothetical protein
MIIEFHTIVIGLIAIIVGALGCYLVMSSTLKNVQLHHAKEVENLKVQILQVKEQGLSVVCYPYDNEKVDKGWFSDDHFVEVGYQFQLFVCGIPCFEAHRVPMKKVEKKEVTLDGISVLKAEVFSILEVIAAKHPAILIGKSAQEITKLSTARVGVKSK